MSRVLERANEEKVCLCFCLKTNKNCRIFTNFKKILLVMMILLCLVKCWGWSSVLDGSWITCTQKLQQKIRYLDIWNCWFVYFWFLNFGSLFMKHLNDRLLFISVWNCCTTRTTQKRRYSSRYFCHSVSEKRIHTCTGTQKFLFKTEFWSICSLTHTYIYTEIKD
jgi:hypothetical protein